MKKFLCVLLYIFPAVLGFSCSGEPSEMAAMLSACVQTPYEARRTITDEDYLLLVRIESLSNQFYFIDDVLLELNTNGEWQNIEVRNPVTEQIPLCSTG
ncbi:MAG: hypothetical protein FWG48_04560 [Oscillospiraceae bacterium]|nr:hypothetical protein [Oscillospiraceae bacterium]